MAAALTTRTLLLIHALFTLCVLVNLLGCIWWNVAETEGLENSWAAASECGACHMHLPVRDLPSWGHVV